MSRRWRLTSSLLLPWMLALGTGAAEALHNLEHNRPAAGAVAAACAAGAPGRQAGHEDGTPARPDAPTRDYGGCAIHAQLHALWLTGDAAEPSVHTGLLGVVPTPPPLLCLSVLAVRLGCRGPPRF